MFYEARDLEDFRLYFGYGVGFILDRVSVLVSAYWIWGGIRLTNMGVYAYRTGGIRVMRAFLFSPDLLPDGISRRLTIPYVARLRRAAASGVGSIGTNPLLHGRESLPPLQARQCHRPGAVVCLFASMPTATSVPGPKLRRASGDKASRRSVPGREKRP